MTSKRYSASKIKFESRSDLVRRKSFFPCFLIARVGHDSFNLGIFIRSVDLNVYLVDHLVTAGL